eukprot:8578036-Heterocapsa_arctica.AAC.1
MKSSFSWIAHASPDEFQAVILAVSPVHVFSCFCPAPVCAGFLASPTRVRCSDHDSAPTAACAAGNRFRS